MDFSTLSFLPPYPILYRVAQGMEIYMIRAENGPDRELSKMVRYGFESGQIWPRNWSDMVSKVGRYDFMDYHIRPL